MIKWKNFPHGAGRICLFYIKLGVSVYIRKSSYCEVIPLLTYADETIEICTVNVSIYKEKFTIIGIYRPHSDTMNNFIHKLDSILNSNHGKYKNCSYQ